MTATTGKINLTHFVYCKWTKRPAPPQIAISDRRIGEIIAPLQDRAVVVRTVLALVHRPITVTELVAIVRYAAAFRKLRTAKLRAVLDDVVIGLSIEGRLKSKGLNGGRILTAQTPSVRRSARVWGNQSGLSVLFPSRAR